MKVQKINKQENLKKIAPSFKARFHISSLYNSRTEKIIQDKLSDYFVNCTQTEKAEKFLDQEFDFKEIYYNFSDAFNLKTKKVGGRVTFHKDTFETDNSIKIKYDGLSHFQGTNCILSKIPEIMLPNKELDKGEPLSHGIRLLVNEVANIIAQVPGYGYGKNNEFANLLFDGHTFPR